jgi:hypothetical protein
MSIIKQIIFFLFIGPYIRYRLWRIKKANYSYSTEIDSLKQLRSLGLDYVDPDNTLMKEIENKVEVKLEYWRRSLQPVDRGDPSMLS